MATTYERLVEAGAPAIVEPLFYRVSEYITNGRGIAIELRERKPRGGSRVLGRREIHTRAASELLGCIAEAARELVAEHDYYAATEALIGEHSSEAGPR